MELPFSTGYHPSHSKHASGRYYTVKKGDSLYKIGRLFGVDYRSLARRNGISYPYTIYVGQRVYLSGTKKASYQAKHKHVTHATRPASSVKRPSSAAYKKPSKRPAKTYTANTGSVRLQWPVKGVLTSRFGRRGSRMHDGIDIGAKQGTPIYAAAAGTVIYSDNKLSGFGNLIIVKHTADLVTIYSHNQKNLVRKNQKVKKGEMIAKVGQTGRATGPHLHFEVRRGKAPNGVRAVDPLAYLPKR